MAYQRIAKGVMKTSTAKNCAIVMVANKQFLAYHLPKFPCSNEGYHLASSSLEVIIDKFNTLAFLNYHNLISMSMCFAYSGLYTMDSIMPLKTIQISSMSMVVGSQDYPKRKCLSSKCE